MLLLATLSHVSGTLTFFVFLVALVYIILIRRAMGRLMGGIADRHIEIRLDLKDARGARERQHQETLQAFSTVTGELKQVGTLAQTVTEARKEPDRKKTHETEPLARREDAVAAREQPPTGDGAKLQASSPPEGNVTEGAGERSSETDSDTLVFIVPSGRTLVGIGTSASPPVAVGGSVGAGAPGG